MKDRIPLIVNSDPEFFGRGSIQGGAGTINAVYSTRPGGSNYATQRPAIALTVSAGASVSDKRGRGIYYWESLNSIYFVNDDTIYKGDYSTVIGTISAGLDPVEFFELGSLLIVLDSGNNEGWTINSGGTLTQITDPDFPTDLAGGGAVLDSILFVLSSTGIISHSAISDPTSWSALATIDAEREPDAGVYLTKHLDHIAVFGSRTIEFFYNAANPTGSVLTRRPDIAYRTGIADKRMVHNSGDKLYFIGSELTGSSRAYKLEAFGLEVVSTPSIDSFLHSTIVQAGLDLIAAGVTVEGHELFLLTSLTLEGSYYTDQGTLVYDNTTKLWGEWKTSINSHTNFPIIKWTDQTSAGAAQGFGIFVNGDIFKFTGAVEAVDTLSLTPPYVEADYILQQDNYIVNLSTDTTSNVELTITTLPYTSDSFGNKFAHKLELIGARTANTSTGTSVNISWSDDRYNTFNTARSLGFAPREKLTRLGYFNDRVFKLVYTGNERVRLENLELDFGASRYA